MHEKPIIIYDSRCPFCIRCKNKIENLDEAKKLKWVGVESLNYKKYNLKKGALLKEMHLISSGKIYRGYYAWKQIAKNAPVLFPLYVLSLFPGIDFFGDKVYKLIARHRYKI